MATRDKRAELAKHRGVLSRRPSASEVSRPRAFQFQDAHRRAQTDAERAKLKASVRCAESHQAGGRQAGSWVSLEPA